MQERFALRREILKKYAKTGKIINAINSPSKSKILPPIKLPLLGIFICFCDVMYLDLGFRQKWYEEITLNKIW